MGQRTSQFINRFLGFDQNTITVKRDEVRITGLIRHWLIKNQVSNLIIMQDNVVGTLFFKTTRKLNCDLFDS